jgi:hypothetical protein
MTPGYDWKGLLTRWNQIVFASEFAQGIPSDHQRTGWLGFPGATHEQLAQTESRLGKRLPASYREFLQFTNGWSTIGLSSEELWDADRICWFCHHRAGIVPIMWAAATLVGRLLHGGLAGLSISDDQYLTYGEHQNVSAVRLSYFFSTLQISDIGDDAVYLLNPQVLTEAGEWEAWLFAAWLPGAVRFPSFWDLMQAEFKSVTEFRPMR